MTLVLALSDQFDDRHATAIEAARQALARIRDEYSRFYYSGIVCERRAKAHLKSGGRGAYGWIREAMEYFEKAEEIRPAANDDAILRWNTCARLLMGNPRLASEKEEAFQTWLE